MINPEYLCRHVIRPVNSLLGMQSRSADRLVLYTMATESDLMYVRQRPSGPARGLGQVEPATHEDIWTNFLDYRPELAERVLTLIAPDFAPTPDKMIANHWYSAAMVRLKYYRDPEPLPQPADIENMAEYWKRVYNTPQGKGKVSDFVRKANIVKELT